MNALIGHKSSVLVPSRRERIWDSENRLWNQTDLGVQPDSTHTSSMKKIIETTADSLNLGIYFKFRSSRKGREPDKSAALVLKPV